MLLAGAASVTCIDSAPWVRDVASDQLYATIIELALQDVDGYYVAEELREPARCDAREVAREIVATSPVFSPSTS